MNTPANVNAVNNAITVILFNTFLELLINKSPQILNTASIINVFETIKIFNFVIFYGTRLDKK